MMCFALGLVLCAGAIPQSDVVEPGEGRTIDLKEAKKVQLPEQPLKMDTGINVLLDHAHQAAFHEMWTLPGALRERGFRVVGSHAALDSVLDPKGKCRIRIPVGKRRPFAWWPNPRYNVVLTWQHDPKAQDYAPEEIAALKEFVKNGGGLVIGGAPVTEAGLNAAYPVNKLAKEFDAQILPQDVAVGKRSAGVLRLGGGWNVEAAVAGNAYLATRNYGKGKVVLCASTDLLNWDEKAPAGDPRSSGEVLKNLAKVLKIAAGPNPVGGTLRLPMSDEGVGGAIYPEMEERVQGAVVFYAKNQFPSVLDTVRIDMPKVDKNVRGWIPSPTPKDPMFLILAAGYGGGWAVNIYEPKEVGIIAPDPDGILSILAHEIAHTCGGPANDKGQAAGNLSGVFSEAHAGWFQRRSDFLRNGKTGHNANALFDFDKDGTHFDLAKSDGTPYGQAWTKLWWLWQKLDERYGTTWYPRWLWVKNVRWAATPNKNLTWDEVVEDMSIACGEDLFPFMRKIGTTLSKETFPKAEFQGKKLTLKPAEISLGLAGVPLIDSIGDYKKPISK